LAERLSRHTISDSQFSVLWACLKAPHAGLAQTELAAELGLSAAHVSGQVEQLRDRGLLDGQRGDRDRRRQVWRVSAEGQNLLQTLLCELELAPGTTAELLGDPAWADVLRLISALAASTNADSNRRIGVGS
jgi:DNA-binding MarR family transcriptional regulator